MAKKFHLPRSRFNPGGYGRPINRYVWPRGSVRLVDKATEGAWFYHIGGSEKFISAIDPDISTTSDSDASLKGDKTRYSGSAGYASEVARLPSNEFTFVCDYQSDPAAAGAYNIVRYGGSGENVNLYFLTNAKYLTFDFAGSGMTTIQTSAKFTEGDRILVGAVFDGATVDFFIKNVSTGYFETFQRSASPNAANVGAITVGNAGDPIEIYGLIFTRKAVRAVEMRDIIQTGDVSRLFVDTRKSAHIVGVEAAGGVPTLSAISAESITQNSVTPRITVTF
jgi:hypothetical protein